MSVFEGLKPEGIWREFEALCQVPRPSKKEDQIIQYLLDFGEKHHLSTQRDEIGNVLICKPATKGMENRVTTVLQSHMDMVCEKNAETNHDFEKDPILPLVDGEWVKAKGTTLGADCGIGMAAQLALLVSDNIEHGPIECLFTVDEETGLTGAFNLKEGFISGTTLLNLDSEDDGELFVGCAGGVDTLARFTYKKEPVPAGYFPIKVSVKGLTGGHSGDDINKGLGNANKILNRFLWASNKKFDLRLAFFDGGNLRNAIAREAHAIFLVPSNQKEAIRVDLNIFASEVEQELHVTEPSLKFTLESTDTPDFVIDKTTQDALLNALYACPHGVFEMSRDIKGLVETSSNLASVKFVCKNQIEVTTSQRSSVNSSKDDIAQMVESVFLLGGAEVKHTDGYPGWSPNMESPIMHITRDSYMKLFNEEPVVRAIHAGLECGLFLEKYPELDMVSFGPTIKGAHSPDERLEIKTVEKFWAHLLDVLENIPKK